MSLDRVGRVLRHIPLHLVIVSLVIAWVVPTFGIFVTSFRSRQAVRETGWWTVFSPPSTPGLGDH